MTDTQQQQQQQDLAKEQQQPLQQIQQQSSPKNSRPSSIASSGSHSQSNSISLIKLDELSSFGATKQSRLPALIKLNEQEAARQPNSMPAMNVDQMEQTPATAAGDKQQVSLPAQLGASTCEGKENAACDEATAHDSADDFQMVDMSVGQDSAMMGPSLPQPSGQQVDSQQQQQIHLLQNKANSTGGQTVIQAEAAGGRNAALANASLQYNQQPSSQLGDSLIDMVINLRNENQNLVRALETNNEYVKERINEFKQVSEDAKRRETQYALEKAEHEHQVRKLQRQNQVLSERLKSMEAKLKDMKLEISDSLAAANSSKASSIRQAGDEPQLYPQLGEHESFGNSALNAAAAAATTIQMDATSGELYHNSNNEPRDAGDSSLSSSTSSGSSGSESLSDSPAAAAGPTAPPMETEPTTSSAANKVGSMSREELGKHFDANKAEFYAMDDPMQQCDKLEKQLNDIGKRDYEICLLQQQLNIYRQDYRLERMANLEAKIQIERLKNDIDRLCLERLNDHRSDRLGLGADQTRPKHHLHRNSHHRLSGGASRLLEGTGAAADAVISKLGHHLNKKASKSAAKAAKYAAKQAHREEKAAAVAAARAAATSSQHHQSTEEQGGHHHRSHRRGHHHMKGLRAVKSEVVNDLMSTANKAMLTGYKMASTHVNLALDKLSAFEQAQANNLAQNRQQSDNKPMGPPSVD